MKCYKLLLAVSFVTLLLISTPALAQSVTVSPIVQIDEALTTNATVAANDAENTAIRKGFPNLRKPLPELVYPVKAKEFQIEGDVLVEYTVNKRGRAQDIRVLKGPGYGCNEEVQRVLRAARFQPILNEEGKPVETKYVSAFQFNLN